MKCSATLNTLGVNMVNSTLIIPVLHSGMRVEFILTAQSIVGQQVDLNPW